MKFLRYSNEQIVWQEVPGETSLAFTITGCPLRCKGCHSSEYRNPKTGEPLLPEYLQVRLEQYRGLITCVLFLGGEWLPELLQPLLEQAQRANIKTCLYSGFDQVPDCLLKHLTYLKTGPWIAARGGLDCPTTNQRFIDLRTNELLNYKFQSPHRQTPQASLLNH
jgi:anaerobic ribonucleoside-triphosphate reductase activating protein